MLSITTNIQTSRAWFLRWDSRSTSCRPSKAALWSRWYCTHISRYVKVVAICLKPSFHSYGTKNGDVSCWSRESTRRDSAKSSSSSCIGIWRNCWRIRTTNWTKPISWKPSSYYNNPAGRSRTQIKSGFEWLGLISCPLFAKICLTIMIYVN